jgi:putative transposase
MPRHARIDAPSALHHIIARDIERSHLFRDDIDRESFMNPGRADLNPRQTRI